MIDIPKKYGKIMIELRPDLVTRTCHKRHYYMVDNKEARKLFERIMREDSEK